MKKSLLAFIIFLTVSCQKKSIDNQKISAVEHIELAKMANEVGIMHNKILADMINNVRRRSLSIPAGGNSSQHSVNSEVFGVEDFCIYSTQATSNYYSIEFSSSYQGVNTAGGHWLVNQLNTVSSPMDAIEFECKNLVNQTNNQGFLTNQETQILNQAFAIFDNIDPNQPEEAIVSQINNSIDAIIAQKNSMYWQPGTGYLISGYLSVLKSSFEFWGSNLSEGVSSANSLSKEGFWEGVGLWARRLNLAQVDAAGYIYGWGKAVIEGGNTERQRIAAGGDNALDWSGIKHFFGKK